MKGDHAKKSTTQVINILLLFKFNVLFNTFLEPHKAYKIVYFKTQPTVKLCRILQSFRAKRLVCLILYIIFYHLTPLLMCLYKFLPYFYVLCSTLFTNFSSPFYENGFEKEEITIL